MGSGRLLTRDTIVQRVAGHQCAAVEVGREDECLPVQPLHDRRGLRLPRHIVVFKCVGEISIQVIVVSIFPLKERIVLGFAYSW